MIYRVSSQGFQEHGRAGGKTGIDKAARGCQKGKRD